MEKKSKSIQFTDDVIDDVSSIAVSLGFKRFQGGEETADFSKVVQRAVDFMLDNENEFRQWLAHGAKVRK